MNSEFYEKEVPVLSREDAIAILNTPDEELDALIDRAKSLRYRYKGGSCKYSYSYQRPQRQLFAGLCLLCTVMSFYRRY